MPVRKTVYLDEGVLERAREHIPERGLSRLLNQMLAQQVEAWERKRIEDEMAEGYIATREDREQLNEDWEVVDFEGWPT